MREIITNIVMITLAIAWLVPFHQIATQGCVYANEPNTAILSFEITLFFAVIGFGAFNIIKLIRR